MTSDNLLNGFTSTWNTIQPDHLPLLDVFTRLRDTYNLPLGVAEYLLVLRALRAGVGWEDRQSLQQLCCMVWAKSEHEADLVCRVIDRVLLERVNPPQTAVTPQGLLRTPGPQAPLLERASKKSAAAAEMVQEGVEPLQAVLAIRRSVPESPDMAGLRFQFLTEYFPVTRRQMKQSWRHMRRKVREGPPEEIDVDATVKKIGREGVLLAPVLLPRRINRAELVLLIDQGGSMVPFHNLTRQLRETAQRGSRLGQTRVYYFHDYPANFLYSDSARLEGQPTDEILARFNDRAAVLIISDAGAARGKFDTKRLASTENFLQQLERSVRYYAWLNPMPNSRWAQTTAGAIARLVPMFEMSRQGLDAAISTLRGRYAYWEKQTPWIR
jgi:uncharacterized protein